MGTSVKITGEWKESLGGKKQERELLAQEVKILGEADPQVNPPIFSQFFACNNLPKY